MGWSGIITPWNFPVAIPGWKLFPALICGNTAVIKPASDTPACLVRFVELLREGGIPPGVVNVVTGSGGEVGNAIVAHPDVRVISFTGHTDTGVEISRTAAETLKRVSLELGGKNPIVVWEDADLDLALDSVVWSAFGTSGQRCTAASRIVVHRTVHDQLRGGAEGPGRVAGAGQRPGRRRPMSGRSSTTRRWSASRPMPPSAAARPSW